MNIHLYGNNAWLSDGKTNCILNSVQTRILLKILESHTIDEAVDCIIESSNGQNHRLTIKQNILNFIENLPVKFNPNDKSNKITGVLEKYYPRFIHIELTNSCNFFCEHCYKEASSQNNIFLPIEIIDKIISKYSGKIQVVVLTGGEPLCHPNINDILSKLTEHFIVNVTTNGSLVHKLPSNLSNKINQYQISIYGYDRESYKLVTKNDGFEYLYKGLEKLRLANKEFTASIVVNKHFLDNSILYKQFIDKFNCTNVLYGEVSKNGRAAYSKSNLWTLNSEELAKARDMFNNLFRTHSSNNEQSDNKTDLYPLCGAGSFHYTVSEQGNVVYCASLDHNNSCIGDIDCIENRSETINNSFKDYLQLMKEQNKVNDMCRFFIQSNEAINE